MLIIYLFLITVFNINIWSMHLDYNEYDGNTYLDYTLSGDESDSNSEDDSKPKHEKYYDVEADNLEDLRKTLVTAIETGNLLNVQLLLPKLDVNDRDFLGHTLLSIALKNGHKQISLLLINKGADLHQSDNFSCICRYGDLHLLDKAFSIAKFSAQELDDGLADAVDCNQLEIAQKLLSTGARVKKQMIIRAVEKHYSTMVVLLASSFNDIDEMLRCKINCLKGNVDEVKATAFLFQDSDFVSECLLYAVRSQCMELVTFIGNRWCEIHRDYVRETIAIKRSLSIAAELGNEKILFFLLNNLKLTLDPNAIDSLIYHNQLLLFESLYKENYIDNSLLNLALVYALRFKKEDFIQQILETYKCKLDASNKKHISSLDALGENSVKTLDLLLAHNIISLDQKMASFIFETALQYNNHNLFIWLMAKGFVPAYYFMQKFIKVNDSLFFITKWECLSVHLRIHLLYSILLYGSTQLISSFLNNFPEINIDSFFEAFDGVDNIDSIRAILESDNGLKKIALLFNTVSIINSFKNITIKDYRGINNDIYWFILLLQNKKAENLIQDSDILANNPTILTDAFGLTIAAVIGILEDDELLHELINKANGFNIGELLKSQDQTNINRTILMQAIRFENYKLAKALIALSDIDTLIAITDRFGNSVLDYAIESNNIDLVNKILARLLAQSFNQIPQKTLELAQAINRVIAKNLMLYKKLKFE